MIAPRMILNLGAGNQLVAPKAGQTVVNHDLIKHRPEIDVTHDLNDLPWPWEDNSVDHVVARAVFEHLRINLFESVGECWRILRPEGILSLKLPHWQHDNAYLDPTHYWRFSLRTCDMFDPDTEYGRDYRFYSHTKGCKWLIIKPARLNNAKSSFFVTLQVRKTLRPLGNLGPGQAQGDYHDEPACHGELVEPSPLPEGEET